MDSAGRIFSSDSGWADYHSKSSELADSGKFTHVLLADLADFYNQINHHRISNALEAAGIPSERSKHVERFLSSLTAKQSRGLPVGPTASIVLAEASLTDVDNFLLRLGAPFARFVDDFRIFCTSRRQAIRIHHDLADYLNTAHRLVLVPGKTRHVPILAFVKEELSDPEEVEKQGRAGKLKEMLTKILRATGYVFGEEDLLAEDKDRIVRENLESLFKDCVSRHPLHLGLARHLLRRATRLRSSVLLKTVFDNLDRLAPVFRDAALYLIGTVPKLEASSYGSALEDYLEFGDFGQLAYIRQWGLHVFERRSDMLGVSRHFDLAEAFVGQLGIRPLAMAARLGPKIDWIRSQKETWNNYGPWDRRAVIHSASVLPTTERKHWLGLVEESTDDPLDRAVAQYSAAI